MMAIRSRAARQWMKEVRRRRFVSLMSTATSRNGGSFDDAKEPFYGSPRPPSPPKHHTFQGRVEIALDAAITSYTRPERADAIARLGDITGAASLNRIRDRMRADPTGRLILQERPVIGKSTIPYDSLIAQAPDDMSEAPDDITFGAAYGYFLKSHNFDPDDRDDVKYIDDEELAYIMLRYRQCHDFWHTLTGLPPTVLGELGLKWLELFQTGLPIAALSSTVGALRLKELQRRILFDRYLPWAYETSQNSSSFLMNVYYERELDTPLNELQERLGIRPAPKV